ncbi:DUF4179 domain-containing protein [Dorea longicatena]|uniref:DUF4179 domain-containing protein n=1 Tax=Dorea longicatena TaxID=88431 RepID=UPI001D078C55|nr:DUF4179 domain-containing protein [Dorea longicatena]MCB6952809.1 DUF4179 domain-containing protein [Dorea longicatena]MCG4677070.1 DUF4179 domain-containing protein [Dorea longicatena]
MTRRNISDTISNISNRHIEEAADFQIGKKGVRKHFIMRRAVAAAATIMLVFTMSVPALAAADYEPAYNLLYKVSPTIAQKLKPVRMSCEDNGIKFEVISAYVEGSEAKIFISAQDIDGDKIDETTDLFDSYSINTPFDCSSSCENISYDTKTKTATFLISISQWNEQDIIGEKITFRVREMLSNKQEYDMVLSDLDMNNISTAPETVTPTHIFGGSGTNYSEVENNFRALKATGILYSPVEGVDITAMGYVDGDLHIQVRYENVLKTDNHGYIYFQNNEGEKITCNANVEFSTDSEYQERYVEYIYDLSDIELAEYDAYGYFVTSDTLITGNWSVTFPLEMVSP